MIEKRRQSMAPSDKTSHSISPGLEDRKPRMSASSSATKSTPVFHRPSIKVFPHQEQISAAQRRDIEKAGRRISTNTSSLISSKLMNLAAFSKSKIKTNQKQPEEEKEEEEIEILAKENPGHVESLQELVDEHDLDQVRAKYMLSKAKAFLREDSDDEKPDLLVYEDQMSKFSDLIDLGNQDEKGYLSILSYSQNANNQNHTLNLVPKPDSKREKVLEIFTNNSATYCRIEHEISSIDKRKENFEEMKKWYFKERNQQHLVEYDRALNVDETSNKSGNALLTQIKESEAFKKGKEIGEKYGKNHKRINFQDENTIKKFLPKLKSKTKIIQPRPKATKTTVIPDQNDEEAVDELMSSIIHEREEEDYMHQEEIIEEQSVGEEEDNSEENSQKLEESQKENDSEEESSISHEELEEPKQDEEESLNGRNLSEQSINEPISLKEESMDQREEAKDENE